MKKGIIFDCDGVIADTESLFTLGSNDHLKSLGIEVDPNDEGNYTGITMESYCAQMIEKYNIDQSLEEYVKTEWDYVNPYFEDENLKPMIGLIDFLEKAKNSGLKMAIASSSSQSYVKHILELFRIGNYFEFIISGEMVEHSKPAPDIYLEAINKLNIPVEDLFAIEDSYAGITSAKAAGLFVVGYKGSIINQDTSNADKEVFSYNELHLSDI